MTRSNMDFVKFSHFLNEIAPVIYAFHPPNVPSREEIASLLCQSSSCIPVNRLWVQPARVLKIRR
ncbi:MAG: hypothetical protein V9819_01450 [Candidatus Dasytiphilus stammeri]